MSDLHRARALLRTGRFTCVLQKGEETLTSTARGVTPLLMFLDSGRSFAGFSAADRVVGKSAAFLYVLLGVAAVHAEVISESAVTVLKNADVSLTYETLVPRIRNRADTGFCPIESAVMAVNTAREALPLIRQRLVALRAESK